MVALDWMTANRRCGAVVDGDDFAELLKANDGRF